MKKNIKTIFIFILIIISLSSASATKYWIGDNTNLVIGSSDSTILIDTTNNRVGIGDSTPDYTLDVETSAANSRAIFADHTWGTGTNYAVYGQTASTSGGAGVYGYASGTSGINYGGFFSTNMRGSESIGAHGIVGIATHATLFNYGGYFTSASTGGRAIYAYSSQRTPALYAESKSSSGYSGMFQGTVLVSSPGSASMDCDLYAGSGGDWYSYTCPVRYSLQYELLGGGCEVRSSPYKFQANRPTSATTWQCGGHGGNKRVHALCCAVT